MRKALIFSMAAAFSFAGALTGYAGQWQQDNTGWRYQENDGSYPASKWHWIDGNNDGTAECYYFGADGYLAVSTIVGNSAVDAVGAWIYESVIQTIPAAEAPARNADLGISDVSAAIYSSSEWVQENGEWKYKTKDGYITSTWKTIGGQKYYFDENGCMASGFQVIGGSSYCFGDNGALKKKTFIEDGVYYVIDNEDGIIIDEVNEFDWSEYDNSGNSFDNRDYSSTALAYEEKASTVTEEEAYEKIIGLKSSYPEGKRWTNDNAYGSGLGCAAFAFIAQDKAFGKNKSEISYDLDWNELRVGDHIRLYGSTGSEHSVIILKVNEDDIKVTEGNYNSSIHWGRIISRDVLEENFIYQETRY